MSGLFGWIGRSAEVADAAAVAEAMATGIVSLERDRVRFEASSAPPAQR